VGRRLPFDDPNEAAMMDRGFSVIELLVALTMTLAIAGALASAVPPAREAFDRVPAEFEMQQRGRTAIDVLSQALRSAGRNVAATESLRPLSDLLPAVSLSAPDGNGAFAELKVIAPLTDPAQGVLAATQGSPAAAMILEADRCPIVADVCGFRSGSTAVIVDGLGNHDVFHVAATVAAARILTPVNALSRPYAAGSAVVEVDELTFTLVQQPDTSYTLVRRTAAGAIQPVVDFVTALSFRGVGQDVAAGFYQYREIDVTVTLEAQTDLLRRVIADRVFRTSIRLRNAP
jgi:Tfp pilus assembly protein PilW